MKVGPSGQVLMCPPEYYGIYYEINPWMSVAKQANRDVALRQWEALYDLYRDLGVTVELMKPAEGLPDMVFTANAGVASGDLFIASNFRHPERRGEEEHFCAWFEAHGYRVERLPKDCFFEGMGDIKLYRDLLFAGFYFRSDIRSHLLVGERAGKLVVSLELADLRFYHLDTCFCPLDDELVMYFPPALQEYSQKAVQHHTSAQLEVGEVDALAFACNCVVVDRHIILNQASPALREALEARGFTVHQVPLSEFLKAGGGAGCLTLAL